MVESVRFFRYESGKKVEESQFLGYEQTNTVPMKGDIVSLRKIFCVDGKLMKKITSGEVYFRKFTSDQGWYLSLWGVSTTEEEVKPL